MDIREFIDPDTEGEFQGKTYKGLDLTPVELPNHVPEAFTAFVDEQSGVVVPWSEVPTFHNISNHTW